MSYDCMAEQYFQRRAMLKTFVSTMTCAMLLSMFSSGYVLSLIPLSAAAGSEALGVLPLQHGSRGQGTRCGFLGTHVAGVAVLPAWHCTTAGKVAWQPAGPPV